MRFPIREILGDALRWLRELWRTTRGSPSALVLVASNLVAAVLALAHPPVSISLLFVYWFECVIIGVINVVKLYFIPVKLGPEADQHPRVRVLLATLGRTFIAFFFVVHYGIFVSIIGAVILGMADQGYSMRTSTGLPVGRYVVEFAWPVAALTVGHVRSFFVNFLGKKEYLARTLENQMFRPYLRMLLMFAVVWAGVFIIVLTRTPALIALVFVPAKIIADLVAHFREHRPRAPSADRNA